MGAWSTSITGNDLAQDLRMEYCAAFIRFAPNTAVKKLDHFVLNTLQADEDSWPDYVYSLAMFMWKHGILTDEIKQRALELIESGAGLDLYDDAATRKKRIKVLDEFSHRICSPQPACKKIRTNWNTKPVFQVGDVVAIRLSTKEEYYTSMPLLSENELRTYDGYWVIVRKIKDTVSRKSSINPEFMDIWPVFELYDYLEPRLPEVGEFQQRAIINRIFSDGKMTSYKKCSATVIENSLNGIENNPPDVWRGLFFHNAASVLITMKDDNASVSPDEIRDLIRQKLKSFG
ncbi:MAG: hypothetical protein RR413_11495 [Christensenellaceae bacterium]